MRIGFNLLLWTGHVTEEHYPIFENLKQAGYDGVEIPIFEGDTAHYEKLGQAIRDHGLACTTVTVIPDEEHSVISAEQKHREAAVERMKHVLECSAACGSELLCGPFHQPLGEFSGLAPSESEKQRGAETHRRIADIAQQHEIMLGIEYLNRFECYFINTMADTAAYVKRVDHPYFKAMYDTFHANIEEKDPVGAIGRHIDAIRHVHISANDRGVPGQDHIDWDGTFAALKEAGYDGWLTIEAFGRALPDLAAATRVWRDFFASRDEVYQQGIELIRRQWAA